MQETIQSRFASSRKELLELCLRNPLLNYKFTKGKDVHIVDEKAEATVFGYTPISVSNTGIIMAKMGMFVC